MARGERLSIFAVLAAAVAIGLWPAALHSPVARPDAAPAFAVSGYEVLDEVDLEGARIGVAVKRGRGGHFYLKARVNGMPLPFIVDTGASYVTLSYKDARRAGISLSRRDFRHEVSTANGRARVAAVKLRAVQYRTIRVRNVVALVVQRGALDINLLGNSFLNKLRTFKVRNGKLIMR